MLSESSSVYRKLVIEGGHFYVCGDCTMAEHVYQTLRKIIKIHGDKSDQDVETFMLRFRVRGLILFIFFIAVLFE